MRRLRRSAAALLAFVIAGLPLSPTVAMPVNHDVIVSDDPADNTPNIIDPPHQNWHVRGIARVGDRIFVGGQFTEIQNAGGGPVHAVTGLFAFDVNTGQIDVDGFGFPVMGGRVEDVEAGSDGQTVFVAGGFGSVDGIARKKVVKLDVGTGDVIGAFKSTAASKKVNDIELSPSGDALYMGGVFTTVKGQPRFALASVDPTTADLLDELDLPVTETRYPTKPVHIDDMDVTPDGSRLLISGNFNKVDGLARWQIAQIDLTASPDVVANWQTARYQANCAAVASKFETYIRGVGYSPDGSYFAVAATGATAINHGGTPLRGPLCDATARFETNATGTDLQPTWATYTGGDTNYSVGMSGAAVYVGGHQRWQNNYFGKDAPKPGSVSRQGIAALSPLNGMPFQWNPARVRGLGSQAMLTTEHGLWVGSDTDEIGDEFHAKIALMPVDGGEVEPPAEPGSFPGTLYAIDQGGTLRGASFDGSTFGPQLAVPNPDSVAWDRARGAFMLSGTIYTGWNAPGSTPVGGVTHRTFNLSNGNAGNQKQVDLRELDTFTTLAAHPDCVRLGDGTVQCPQPQFPNMSDQLKNATSAFWDPATGRLFYTTSTQQPCTPAWVCANNNTFRLYSRYYLPESDLMGDYQFTECQWSATPAQNTCGNFNPSQVRGATLVDGMLYFGKADGSLWRMGFDSSAGLPTGAATQIGGPGIDGNDWNSRGLFAGSP